MATNTLELEPRSRKNGRMGRKKGGQHKTPRKPVQFPVPWLELARKHARQKRQHVMWWIVGLIADEVARNGETEFPVYPWDEEGPSLPPKK